MTRQERKRKWKELRPKVAETRKVWKSPPGEGITHKTGLTYSIIARWLRDPSLLPEAASLRALERVL